MEETIILICTLDADLPPGCDNRIYNSKAIIERDVCDDWEVKCPFKRRYILKYELEEERGGNE